MRSMGPNPLDTRPNLNTILSASTTSSLNLSGIYHKQKKLKTDSDFKLAPLTAKTILLMKKQRCSLTSEYHIFGANLTQKTGQQNTFNTLWQELLLVWWEF